eukprot:COSAG05_NODE_2362_length_3175_cov_2.304616_2_plen_194_part_00
MQVAVHPPAPAVLTPQKKVSWGHVETSPSDVGGPKPLPDNIIDSPVPFAQPSSPVIANKKLGPEPEAEPSVLTLSEVDKKTLGTGGHEVSSPPATPMKRKPHPPAQHVRADVVQSLVPSLLRGRQLRQVLHFNDASLLGRKRNQRSASTGLDGLPLGCVRASLRGQDCALLLGGNFSRDPVSILVRRPSGRRL